MSTCCPMTMVHKMSLPCFRDPSHSYLPTVLARFLISTARSGARNIGGFSERRLRSQLRRCFHRPNISPDTSPEATVQGRSTPKETPIGQKKRKRIARAPESSSSNDEHRESDEGSIMSSGEEAEERHTRGKGDGKRSQK